MKTYQSAFWALALVALVSAVSGCGGGGSGGEVVAPAPTPAPAPVPAPVPVAASSAQGFWAGAVDATTNASAVILDNGDAWVVFQSGGSATGFARAALTVTGSAYSGSGNNYRLADNTVQGFSISGSIQGTSTLQTSVVIGAQAATAPAALTYDRRYLTAASQADATGRWRSTFNNGASVVTLDIAAAGTLAGSSTTGCSYSGALTPRAGNVAVFDLTLNETCLNGTAALAGIGTINEAKTSLFLAFTSPDRSRGGLLVAGR